MLQGLTVTADVASGDRAGVGEHGATTTTIGCSEWQLPTLLTAITSVARTEQ